MRLQDAMAQQCALLQNLARQCDERGYCVVIHKLNMDATANQFGYNYLLGGVQRFIEDWGRANARRPIVVNVTPEAPQGLHTAQAALQNPFYLNVRVPDLARYRPILAAVEIVAREIDSASSRYHGYNKKQLTYAKHSSWVEIHGVGREALEIVLRILAMPHHRDILTAPYRGK